MRNPHEAASTNFMWSDLVKDLEESQLLDTSDGRKPCVVLKQDGVTMSSAPLLFVSCYC
jgi:hypothetical protein